MPRPIGYDILCLITAVLGALVALASAINITHARDSNPDSPEPGTWANILGHGFVGLCGAIAALVGLLLMTRHFDYLHPLGIGLWLVGVVVLGWINVDAWAKALLSFRIKRERCRRRELQADARRRYPYSLSALALVGLLAFSGCTQQQAADIQAKEASLAQGADNLISTAQQQLTIAQEVATAYQAELAATAPTDKNLKKVQAKVAKAQAEIAKWQIYLTLAKVGIKVVEAQAVPATTPFNDLAPPP